MTFRIGGMDVFRATSESMNSINHKASDLTSAIEKSRSRCGHDLKVMVLIIIDYHCEGKKQCIF